MTSTTLFFPLFAAAVTAFAAPATRPAIGMAAASGSFQIDQARVTGNGTVFRGSIVETAGVPSQIHLEGGQRVRLSTESRVQVFENKAVLESGFGQLESAPGFEMEARSLRIAAASADTVTRIRLAPGHKVMVAAVRGSVRVTNAAGLLVAAIRMGESLDFEPQPDGSPVATQVSGCLLQRAGKLILAEQTTNLVLELQGADLMKLLGNRVSIQGEALEGSAQAVKVTSMTLLAKGGCTAIAKKLGATTAVGAAAAAGAAAASSGGAASGAGAAAAGAGAATAAGMGIGTVAVVGGVAAAATVGGLAAVGSLPGQAEEPPVSASR
jgi:hypothetical protein